MIKNNHLCRFFLLFSFYVNFIPNTTTVMSYHPGTHIIATLTAADPGPLENYDACKKKIDELIEKYGLQKLGEVYHNFSPAGFTAVVCLSESHLSIHTWPEYKKINLDIYLSNYQRSNDNTVAGIYEELILFFDAMADSSHTINR